MFLPKPLPRSSLLQHHEERTAPRLQGSSQELGPFYSTKVLSTHSLHLWCLSCSLHLRFLKEHTGSAGYLPSLLPDEREKSPNTSFHWTPEQFKQNKTLQVTRFNLLAKGFSVGCNWIVAETWNSPLCFILLFCYKSTSTRLKKQNTFTTCRFSSFFFCAKPKNTEES